jgi:hypothetical protein
MNECLYLLDNQIITKTSCYLTHHCYLLNINESSAIFSEQIRFFYIFVRVFLRVCQLIADSCDC